MNSLVLAGFLYESSESTAATGENKSGHIEAAANEGILFFDSQYMLEICTIFPLILYLQDVFPLKLNWLLSFWQVERTLPETLWRFNNQALAKYDPLALVKSAMKSVESVKVTEVLPRLKDGGVFVKFSHPDGTTATEIEGEVSRYLGKNPIKPWFAPFRRVSTNMVVGKPWLEDLHRFPSLRIKVEFVAPPISGAEASELSQETLYSVFRKYGKIAEITSQPSDSKVLPKFAYLDFDRLRHAVMARNCLHGFKVAEELGGGSSGTVLRLSYEPRMKSRWIRDYIANHPRVVIPALAALVATITVAVFDPIRTFFIKAHIDHAFNLKDNMIYKWFKSQASDLLSFRLHRSEEVSLYVDRIGRVADKSYPGQPLCTLG